MLIFIYIILLQNGDTPLHIAAAMGRRKLVRILLEYGFTSETDTSKTQAEGTNISALNLQHEKAIDIAQRKENLEIVEMLKNPSSIVANPNTTSSGIVENIDDIALDHVQDNTKGKFKDTTDKSAEKKRKKKYQKYHSSDKMVKYNY